jgi:hypothetical protein
MVDQNFIWVLYKSVLSLDRQQANTTKITNTSIDRAFFGLAEVN